MEIICSTTYDRRALSALARALRKNRPQDALTAAARLVLGAPGGEPAVGLGLLGRVGELWRSMGRWPS